MVESDAAQAVQETKQQLMCGDSSNGESSKGKPWSCAATVSLIAIVLAVGGLALLIIHFGIQRGDTHGSIQVGLVPVTQEPIHEGPGSWPTPPLEAPASMVERRFQAVNDDPTWSTVFDDPRWSTEPEVRHMVPPGTERIGQVQDLGAGVNIVVRDGVKLVYVTPVGVRVFPSGLMLDAPKPCQVPLGSNFAEIGTLEADNTKYTAVEYLGEFRSPTEVVLDDEPRADGYCSVGTAFSTDVLNIVLPLH